MKTNEKQSERKATQTQLKDKHENENKSQQNGEYFQLQLVVGRPFVFGSAFSNQFRETKQAKTIMSLCFFSDNICPGLPWFQCWTNIIRKNPDAIQNGLACDWVSSGQEFIETGEKKLRREECFVM